MTDFESQELHELNENKMRLKEKFDYASGPEYDYYTDKVAKPTTMKKK